jgi:CspA family cold shock protein
VKQQDQICYCDRCGISFLWSVEEQKHAAESVKGQPPAHCPGCRQLLPTSGRERGVVKWYSPRKHYGFVTRQEGNDLFVHESGVEPGTRLAPGVLVEFDVTHDAERGWIAGGVKALSVAADNDENSV